MARYAVTGPLTGERPDSTQEYPPWLSAEQILGVIAYGRLNALNEPAPGEPPFFERWNIMVSGGYTLDRRHPLAVEMRRAIARAKWWKMRKRLHSGLLRCPILPLDGYRRACVRLAIRRQKTSATLALKSLLADVRQLHSARDQWAAKIDAAISKLCDGVSSGAIVAFGRPGEWRKKSLTGIHEPIPPQFFASAYSTITRDGWATCHSAAPDDLWVKWRGPDWGDLRFKRADAVSWLGLVSLATSDHAEIGPEASNAPFGRQTKNQGGRPQKWDWDAFDRQLMRMANSLDGLPERHKLGRVMLDWCSVEWNDTPAESAVRARIVRIYPE
jgi:hypothetical protein